MIARQKILVIFLLALVARLGAYAAFGPRPIQYDDGPSWNAIAVNLLEGRGFTDQDGLPTSVRPPVYPLFLAGVYAVFGMENFTAARLIQVVLSALTCILVFFLAARIFSESIGFWAGIVAAVHPPLIVYCTSLASETLYTFLLALTLLIFTRAFDENRPGQYVAAGLCLGLTNLCRSTLSFYPFFFITAAFLIVRFRDRIKGTAAVALLSFLVISPWTLRNYRVFGDFLLVNISAGQLFWLGTLEETEGGFTEIEHPAYRQFDHLTLERPIEAEREHFRAGLRNIRAKPLAYARLSVVKFFRLWFKPIGHTLTARRSQTAAAVLLAGHVLFVLLALYGLVRSGLRLGTALPLIVLFIYFSIMHNIIAPMPRFRLPVEPFLIIFAVFAAGEIGRARRTPS